MKTTTLLILGLLAAPQFLVINAGASSIQEAAPEANVETLDAEPKQLVDAVLASEVPAGEMALRAASLFDAAVLAHGDVKLLQSYLAQRIGGAEDDATKARGERLAGYIAWRFGDLDGALARFAALAERNGADLDAQLVRARLLDASGKAKEALAAYGDIVDGENSAALTEESATRLRLRMALMAMESGGEDGKDALIKFASEEGRPVALRNRCATVLALLGRPGDAADLYVVTGDAPETAELSERKRALKAAANGELRVAEWALRAEDYGRAQGAAWRAVHKSSVARERRYGLTLLAEAHRGDGSLPKLLERFSTERDGLPAEARRAWIELLRETGSTDEAIAMTQGAQAADFSREERRRLLEMYREAGRADEMVTVYREWIGEEPEELVWRSGLSRHFLEEGDRAGAVAVWEEWFGLEAGPDRARPLDAADELESLGLDDLAIRAAELAIEAGREPEAAFLFMYDLHRDRGQLDLARVALDRLDAYADPGSPARMPLSDCMERLGDLDEAVRILENVRAARGAGKAGEDLEMRLAWLYSEVGDEEKALELWKELWTRVKSIARRRFVEDRLMTVASRLGVLADIAVDLEKKLFAGEADQKDSGLLVRLYTKVGDAVSAAEVIDEFLRRSGGTELEGLTEKARIYLACNDYYHYEKAVAELVELDPEGRPDYYRQLAMSQLERGKPDQARTTLMNLQDLPGGDDSSAEFEAGVLALSGMRDEAIGAYRRGLAAHPERIDSYLLMANLLKEIREADTAVGMFQHLAETAERDDLFTIAIDGLLNMLVDAPARPKMTEWARRITLERLAATEDRPYLYQLLADLADETKDNKGQLAALENSLASAGPRRASILRELMDLSKPARASFGSPGRDGNRKQQLAFGRRLVGLGELVPPDVYLDLGDAFLEEGDEASAARTFDLTREFPDGELYQAQAAERFEKAGFVDRALDRYQAVLAASPTDVKLLAKVGELTESLGDDAAAIAMYRRAYDILLSRKTVFEGAREEEKDSRPSFSRNVDEYDQSIERVIQGLLATLPDDAAVKAFLAGERAAMEAELPEALAAAAAQAAETEDGESEALSPSLARHPRLLARAEIVRRVSFAAGHPEEAEAMDRWAMAAFPGDESLMEVAVGVRVQWGRFAAAKKLLAEGEVGEELRQRLMARLGEGGVQEAASGQKIAFDVAVSEVVPTLARGDMEGLKNLLRRVDTVGIEKDQIGRFAVLFAAARVTEDPQTLLSVGREWLRQDLENKTSSYVLEDRIETVLGAMDKETGLAVGRYLVSRVLEEPEENSTYVTLLPKLAQRLGEEVVDPEDVRTLLDEFGQKYAWGLGPVLALLPAKDRAGALRGVWSKLEAANRAGFLLGLVSESTEDIPLELAEFLQESFPAALEEADDFIQYRIGELLDVEHSHGLCLNLAKQVLEVKPEFEQVRASILVHRAALGEEGLDAEAAEVWMTLVSAMDDDYQMRRAKDKLEEVFAKDAIDPFLAALDAEAANKGEDAKLTQARVNLLLGVDRTEEAMVALTTALEKEEDNKDLLQQLRRVYRSRGERIAAAETLEKLAALAEEKGDESGRKRHLKGLVREWTTLRAPERALVAKTALGGDDDDAAPGIPGMPAGFVLPVGAMISINGVMFTGGDAAKKEGPPKSFKAAREALAEGDDEEATRIFRRLWRQFPEGQPQTPRYFSARRYRNLALANLRWPADEDAGAEEEKAAKERSKGGLLSYEPEEPEQAPEPPNAYERIAESQGLVAEQRRFLRTVQSYELDRLQQMLEGLLSVDIAAAGEAKVLDELLARAEDGTTGRADQIRLLAMLDRAPDRVTGAAAEALSGLVRTIPPRDASQVRRLSRVLLQSGSEDVALRLYGWCARLAGGGRFFGGEDEDLDVVTYVSVDELVQEARDHLEGDAQIALIEDVLKSAKPADSPWERENYEELVLRTWSEVLGPERALERARPVAEAATDLSTGLRRSVAIQAVPLFLAAGEQDKALRALEVGIAKLDPADVTQSEERWYRKDPTRFGFLRTDSLRKFLPVAGEGVPNYGPWLMAFSGALEEWLEADRVSADSTVQALCLAATRLAEAGMIEEAQALSTKLAARAGLSPTTELWVIDVLRASGQAQAATDREVELLKSARLHPERVAETAREVLETLGGAACLEASAALGEVMRHPEFIDVMLAAAREAGNAEVEALWTSRGESARAAEAALEEKK